MTNLLTEHFGCPYVHVQSPSAEALSSDAGYFSVDGHVIFGRSAIGFRSENPDDALFDISSNISMLNGVLSLPFDINEICDNLRLERYCAGGTNGNIDGRLLRALYYAMRPCLPLQVRKHLQRWRLQGWQSISFPHWPVDCTVDILLERLLVRILESGHQKKIPMIWFWPDGAEGAAIMTHDVEEEVGRKFSYRVMDIDEEFNIPASFQIVPEKRYTVTAQFLHDLRQRGFEITVQDLNHDGRLFGSYEQFVRRVKEINRYGLEFGAAGYRSAILYRNEEWYGLFNFEYDMSIPNVAHLDPQRGGCCTVKPYFIGKILELPVTTSQDHTLFNILNDYSLDHWSRQSELILKQHGLISFIIHPDYVVTPKAQASFRALLGYLNQLRASRNVWIARPGEVNRWWRQRSRMNIVEKNGMYSIVGEGSERARLAYASLQGGELTYSLEPRSSSSAHKSWIATKV